MNLFEARQKYALTQRTLIEKRNAQLMSTLQDVTDPVLYRILSEAIYASYEHRLSVNAQILDVLNDITA
jgi:hypothetical protein